jgi:uncharacterized protein (TIGR03435 family)
MQLRISHASHLKRLLRLCGVVATRASMTNSSSSIQAGGPADLSLADARRMMQLLLRDRFKLRVRVEQRELPVYALVLARANGTLGRGLRRSKTDCTAYSTALARSGRLEVARQVGPAECTFNEGGGLGGGRLFVKGTGTIRDMLRAFSRSPDIDRRIVDRTGLTETFDIDFVWTPDRSGPGAASPVDVVSIFTALQEQLGLKLESRREPGDVVVIESVERPTPNERGLSSSFGARVHRQRLRARVSGATTCAARFLRRAPSHRS